MTVAIHSFDSKATLVADLAARIAAALDDAIRRRGSASLALCGGTTPEPVFHLLADADIDWRRVIVTLTDERWVPQGDALSNQGLLQRSLLAPTGRACAARLVALFNGAPTPELGLSQTASALADLPRLFDLVLLGMGADGHTASLFPRSTGLAEGLGEAADCVAVRLPDPSATPRISLSLSRLLAARSVMLLITGDDKRHVLDCALAGGDVHEMPVRAVLHQSATPIDIFWAP